MPERHIREVNPHDGCPLCSDVIPVAFIAEIIAEAAELSEPMSENEFMGMLINASST